MRSWAVVASIAALGERRSFVPVPPGCLQGPPLALAPAVFRGPAMENRAVAPLPRAGFAATGCFVVAAVASRIRSRPRSGTIAAPAIGRAVLRMQVGRGRRRKSTKPSPPRGPCSGTSDALFALIERMHVHQREATTSEQGKLKEHLKQG